eukprot:CAMPEP_0184692402 /NCGR_PEP_ID=MMETSP0313-20130426/899_1 /TAXON_ID=2792 /ORGANISM="Porphyridium aerugineum, Strain SAG 1380-2" /LENGTH=441 /DNA_ID=CAMNT_0027150229 /DNA_START=174 /DNA_END=1499 /DNA_ORIENTATION=-
MAHESTTSNSEASPSSSSSSSCSTSCSPPSPESMVDIFAAKAVETSPASAPKLVKLKNMSLKQLEDWVETLGEKRFRGKQLFRQLHKNQAASFDEMTDLAKPFREKLKSVAQIDSLAVKASHVAPDGTRKIQYQLLDGLGIIESVLIPGNNDRWTLCVSTQLGCGMNCQFCFTAKMGLVRNLELGEIVDQAVIAQRLYMEPGRRIPNIVVMGMGEASSNPDNVIQAMDIWMDGQGMEFSHNKITVSTAGDIPFIKRLLKESKANLAISLNASNNEVRNWIMPINRKYPLEDLMKSVQQALPRRNSDFGSDIQKKVFFEYVMLKGINDSLEDAQNVVRLVSHVPCKINLIPFNTHIGSEFESTPMEQIYKFQDFLVKKGILVTIRTPKGDTNQMACGQLGGPTEFARSPPRLKAPERFQKVLNVPASGSGKSRAEKTENRMP